MISPKADKNCKICNGTGRVSVHVNEWKAGPWQSESRRCPCSNGVVRLIVELLQGGRK